MTRDDAPPVIVWFRNDLRLADNAALAEAAATGQPVIPVYIVEALGGAARWWLHHSLDSLGQALAEHDLTLVLRAGPASEALPKLVKETGATRVHWNRRYDPDGIATDTALKEALGRRDVAVESFNGSLLHEPWSVRNGSGDAFRVFTPFWRTARALDPGACIAVPKSLRPWPGELKSQPLDSFGLLPTKPDWAGGLSDTWVPGEAAAQKALGDFVDGPLDRYAANRNRPDMEATSRLSPRLRWGEISPRQVWHATQAAVEARGPKLQAPADKFLSELGWREFSYHLLFAHKTLQTEPIRPEFAQFPWQPNAAHLAAWQRGRTGFALVDAGMRQLWHTGWMHNRVRMVVASVLVKHLLQPWQDGERWFMDTLVDADPANNGASWQWVAGCGADAAPYFRVFNPVLQGHKFDPKGEYVRHWVPERADLDNEAVQEPIDPLVGLDEGRQRALAAFAAVKKSE